MPRKALPIRNQVVAMIAQNIKHTDIAKALNCSVATVSRISQEVTRDVQAADDNLTRLRGEISKVITTEQRATKYANLAMSAKNEAVSLGALQRIDDLDGIVTDKERLRSKGVEHSVPTPMFQLAAGLTVNVTVSGNKPQESTTGCGLQKSEVEVNKVIDIKPIESSE